MAKYFEFGADGMPMDGTPVDPAALSELAAQPVEPAPLNPNYGRKSVPATIIIDQVMQDRSSFIDNLTNQLKQGEK